MAAKISIFEGLKAIFVLFVSNGKGVEFAHIYASSTPAIYSGFFPEAKKYEENQDGEPMGEAKVRNKRWGFLGGDEISQSGSKGLYNRPNERMNHPEWLFWSDKSLVAFFSTDKILVAIFQTFPSQNYKKSLLLAKITLFMSHNVN